jgi:hypothetical protein
MKIDKNRRAGLLKIREQVLQIEQSELATLADVSLETVVRYERCEEVSLETDTRIGSAIVRLVMKRNPELTKRAVQPFLDATEEWEKIPSVQPGTELAAQLEKLKGESLAELKAYAEKIAIFRRAANNFLSLTK